MDTNKKFLEIIEETCERYNETFTRLAMGEDSGTDEDEAVGNSEIKEKNRGIRHENFSSSRHAE